MLGRGGEPAVPRGSLRGIAAFAPGPPARRGEGSPRINTSFEKRDTPPPSPWAPALLEAGEVGAAWGAGAGGKAARRGR